MTNYWNHIIFGDGLSVTDEGGGIIRVDGGGGGGGGGGIQFDTYPQAGDWLYVEGTDGSTGAGGSPNGYEIEFYATGADAGLKLGSGWDIILDATHNMELTGSNRIEFSSGSSSAQLTSGQLSISIDGSNTLVWVPTLGAFAGYMLDTTGGYLHIQSNGIRMQAAAGKAMTLYADTTMDIIAPDFISIGGGGGTSGAGGVLVSGISLAANGGTGAFIGYVCAGDGGFFGTYDTAGHFFNLNGGGVYDGSDSADSYFEVRDYSTTQPLLRIVRVAGGGSFTFHILTGATWVADL